MGRPELATRGVEYRCEVDPSQLLAAHPSSSTSNDDRGLAGSALSVTAASFHADMIKQQNGHAPGAARPIIFARRTIPAKATSDQRSAHPMLDEFADLLTLSWSDYKIGVRVAGGASETVPNAGPRPTLAVGIPRETKYAPATQQMLRWLDALIASYTTTNDADPASDPASEADNRSTIPINNAQIAERTKVHG